MQLDRQQAAFPAVPVRVALAVRIRAVMAMCGVRACTHKEHLEINSLVRREAHVAQGGARALGKHLHRHDHAVVLRHRHDDLQEQERAVSECATPASPRARSARRWMGG